MITRRSFVLGASATAALAACSLGDKKSVSTSESLIAFFDPNLAIVTGIPQRLPLGYGNKDGIPNIGGPKSLTFSFSGPSSQKPITAQKTSEGLPRPIWVPVATFTKPGLYTVSATAEQGTIETSFTVVDPDKFPVPGIGGDMPKFDTPTILNHRGVEPYCTKKVPCPLHLMTLTDGLNSGKPTAFLVSTPAHCKTATCGPTLDFLVAENDTYGDRINLIHAEVFKDEAATEYADIITDLKLPFEPVLFCVDKWGKIIDRLDGVFGAEELRSALKNLAP